MSLSLFTDTIYCLEQGMQVLNTLDDAVFRRTCSITQGTIGSHFRHNIEHYFCLLEQWRDGVINYDIRRREMDVEASVLCALEYCKRLKVELQMLDETQLPTRLEVYSDSGLTVGSLSKSQSSFHRELQFLVSHTIHHYALIAMLCRYMSIQVPDDFGIAPSTLRYRASMR